MMLDGLLSGMRDTVLRTLGASVGIKTSTRARTPTGGSSYTFVLSNTLPGRLMATSNQEMQFAEKMGIAATHVAILQHDAVVAVDDRLVVDGVEYVVTGMMEHQTPVLVKVLCARVDS